MPSPFPGMDPYLEEPVLWPGVHQRLITCMAAALNAELPAHYAADIGERPYVLQEERDIYPDVAVLESPSARGPAESGAGGVALASPTATLESATSDEPWVVTADATEMREVFIEVLSLREQERLVTVIEVLSPANKAEGTQGRRLYLRKQRELLESETHLIEVDLLREGTHTVAVPKGRLIRRGAWDYLVCLHRGTPGGRYEVWAVPLRERLPRLRVPLAGEDPDAVLDLQAAFDRCYDEGAYARRLDYQGQPPAPLRSADETWADGLLRERRLP